MSIKARDWAWQQASKVQPVPLLVLLAIAESCYGESVSAEIGQRRLAGKIGRPQKMIPRAVAQLVAAGLVELEQGTGRHSQRTTYTLQTDPSEGSVQGRKTDPSEDKTDPPQGSEPIPRRDHVPGVPAVAGTTPTNSPSAAAGGSARVARRAPRGKYIQAAEREYTCADCRLPGDSGLPARWWREDGEVVTAHVECPSEDEQREHWRIEYGLPEPDDLEAIAAFAERIDTSDVVNLPLLRSNLVRGYGKGNSPIPIVDAFKRRKGQP